MPENSIHFQVIKKKMMSKQIKMVIVLTTKSVYNEVEKVIHYFDTFGRGVFERGKWGGTIEFDFRNRFWCYRSLRRGT
jgi:hypothetical protein